MAPERGERLLHRQAVAASVTLAIALSAIAIALAIVSLVSLRKAERDLRAARENLERLQRLMG